MDEQQVKLMWACDQLLGVIEGRNQRVRELENALRQRDTEFCKALIAHLDTPLIERVMHTFNEIRFDRWWPTTQ